MAISLIQQTIGSKTNAVAGNNTSVMANTTTGNMMVVGIMCETTTNNVSGITDGTNVFVKIGLGVRIGSTPGNGFISLWYAKNIVGLTTPTITATVTGAGVGSGMVVAEYSGLDTTAPLDKSLYTAGGTAAITSGATAVTTNANELVVGFGASDWGNNTYTVGAGYGHLKTMGNVDLDASMEDKIVAATGAQTATLTLGNASDNAGGVATFIGASGGGGVTLVPRRSMIGVGF